MTFTEIVTEIKERLNLTSATSTTRVGRLVNVLYKRVTNSLNIDLSRRSIGVVETTTPGIATVTWSDCEKTERVIDDHSGTKVILKEITVDDIVEPRITDAINEAVKKTQELAARKLIEMSQE